LNTGLGLSIFGRLELRGLGLRLEHQCRPWARGVPRAPLPQGHNPINLVPLETLGCLDYENNR